MVVSGGDDCQVAEGSCLLASWPPALLAPGLSFTSGPPGLLILASFLHNPSSGEGLGQEETAAPGLT